MIQFNQSIYISCLWDSSGESIDDNWENNIHYALSVQGFRQKGAKEIAGVML